MSILTKHDSAKYSETVKNNPALNLETEGGWQITRPRTTKRPARVFRLGFTELTNAQKEELQQLFDDMRGSSEIITNWKHPISGTVTPVRFAKEALPEFNYVGKGGLHRWDVSNVILEEAE